MKRLIFFIGILGSGIGESGLFMNEFRLEDDIV